MARRLRKVGCLDRSRWSGEVTRKVETVLTCDYNGWNDAPEAEREWFDEHPEIWGGSIRAADVRLIRATPRTPMRRFRGGMAA
jgi:hypothetical protein